jgi:hypothetical protein
MLMSPLIEIGILALPLILGCLGLLLKELISTKILITCFIILSIPSLIYLAILAFWFWAGDGEINTRFALIFYLLYPAITVAIIFFVNNKIQLFSKLKGNFFLAAIFLLLLFYINIFLIYHSVNLIHLAKGSKMIIE